MEKDTLNEILANHKDWLNGNGGQKAYLRGADLRGANLRGADLGGADLREANLRGADLGGLTIIQIGPIGSRKDYLIVKRGLDLDEVMAGCWKGSLKEFEDMVTKTHGNNQFAREYKAAIEMVKKIFGEDGD